MYKTHKKNTDSIRPKVSLILLDWSCRERFHTLDWLNDQNCPRSDYEIIWVELYDRVVDKVMEKADVVITCHQEGMYHKHLGYNVGLIEARGDIVTVCDSDAVFPREFIESLTASFSDDKQELTRSLVRMHYQYRTTHEYPDELNSIDEIDQYEWLPLWPNVGACVSVLRRDAIRFGGFDEDESYRGYYCGPYDLGWRMVNAGIPESWEDESVALWHFAHPNPAGGFWPEFSIKLWKEITHPHYEYHATTAVDAFCSGRVMPLKESDAVFAMRMSNRVIGTTYEKNLADATGRQGFSRQDLWALRATMSREFVTKLYRASIVYRLYKQTKRKIRAAKRAVQAWLGIPPKKKKARATDPDPIQE